METIRQNVNAVKLMLEDPSIHPQHAIAYPNKYIYYMILIAKDSYIFQLKNTNQRPKPSFTEYFLPCFQMVPADTNECPSNPNSNCIWMKGKRPVPKFKGNMLSFVKPTDTPNVDTYGYVEWNDIMDLKRSRHSFNLNNKYSLRNVMGEDWLYIHTFESVKPRLVSIYAPFNDMVEIVKYMSGVDVDCGCGKFGDGNMGNFACNFMDRPMDIPQEHKRAIYEMVLINIKNLEPKKPIDRKTDDIDYSMVNTL